MTGGAGFSRMADGINKRNRAMLRGNGDATYKNFDKSYITDYIISRKPLLFKEASPEYMEQLHARLVAMRKKEIRRKVKAFVVSLGIVGVIAFLLFFNWPA